jgi:hypothetical protein
MNHKEREELRRKLEQSRRFLSEVGDPTSMERLIKLAADIEGQLKEPK